MAKNKFKIMARGFSLIEMLLVAVVISVMLLMSMNYLQQKTLSLKIDKTSMEMQQILNAALAYFVNNGSWRKDDGNGNVVSVTLDCLKGKGNASSPCSISYLPASLNNSPFMQPYTVSFNTVTQNFQVQTTLPNAGIAAVVAGKIPLGVATGTIASGEVNAPGQNLSDASSVNFAGIYHSGACVPAPQCPNDSHGDPMTPRVMVVPVSVSGRNDDLVGGSNTSNSVYPISSFTAYATGKDINNGTPVQKPLKCGDLTVSADCSLGTNSGTGGLYWRVCLHIITEKGELPFTNGNGDPASWAGNVSVMAITRCSVSNEAAGSSFDVYSN